MVIVGLLVVFMALSMLLVHSATVDSPSISIGIPKMILIFTIGIIGFLAAMMVDYKAIVKIVPYLYGAGILMLVAVYVLGTEINGARGWFKLPFGFDFQPVELFKLILIIALAAYMARKQGENLELLHDVIPIGLIMFVPFVLVVIQPDLGNAVIFIVILLGIYWIGNIKYTHVLVATSIIAGVLFFLSLTLYQSYHEEIRAFLKSTVGSDHWMGRIDTFLNPSAASKKDSYHVQNAIIAIGSGSLFGEGYLHGSSIHSNFIPIAYTDSIFVVVGEEFGFVGCSVLLLLYFVFIYRMIIIGIQCTDITGSYIIVGIVSMLVFQIFFENVGMMIGIMPLTGITLPFVSYGGSSLLINMISIGFVMSIKVHQETEPSY